MLRSIAKLKWVKCGSVNYPTGEERADCLGGLYVVGSNPNGRFYSIYAVPGKETVLGHDASLDKVKNLCQQHWEKLLNPYLEN